MRTPRRARKHTLDVCERHGASRRFRTVSKTRAVEFMDVTFSYQGRSDLKTAGGARVLSLAPNLSRAPVAFDGALRAPLLFREAMSALHDVVINDLRFKPRDKSAYENWKADERDRLQRLRQHAAQEAHKEIEALHARPIPADLEQRYQSARKFYWKARNRYARYLFWHDNDLWRKLMPCDPIITVADDVVFFECFSADESSYGCLTVDREETFGPSANLQTGTTNVDYSWDLYHHFQSLRSYRETRFTVDPSGFEVATQDRENYREEKIDLPAGWLRGFLQLQSAMAMPMRKISLSREAVYSLLAWLKRNKAQTSPRAVRFELKSGQAPEIVLEPWEKRIVSRGTIYHGPNDEPIRIWGRRRLLTLARVLPLAEGFDVYLLGTGLPTFWVARMGGMRLTLGLSGWTTNDWTRGSALDALAPPAGLSAGTLSQIANDLERRGAFNLRDDPRSSQHRTGRVRDGSQQTRSYRRSDLRPIGRFVPLAADHAQCAGRSRLGAGESRTRRVAPIGGEPGRADSLAGSYARRRGAFDGQSRRQTGGIMDGPGRPDPERPLRMRPSSESRPPHGTVPASVGLKNICPPEGQIARRQKPSRRRPRLVRPPPTMGRRVGRKFGVSRLRFHVQSSNLQLQT